MLQDEARAIRAANQISYLLLHYTDHNLRSLAATYLKWILDTRNFVCFCDPSPSQLRAIANLHETGSELFDDSTEVDMSGDTLSGKVRSYRAEYLKLVAQEAHHASRGDVARETRARKDALQAYKSMREAGGSPLFGDAFYVAMMYAGVELHQWRIVDAIAAVRTQNAIMLLSESLSERLDKAITSRNWNDLLDGSLPVGTEEEVRRFRMALDMPKRSTEPATPDAIVQSLLRKKIMKIHENDDVGECGSELHDGDK